MGNRLSLRIVDHPERKTIHSGARREPGLTGREVKKARFLPEEIRRLRQLLNSSLHHVHNIVSHRVQHQVAH